MFARFVFPTVSFLTVFLSTAFFSSVTAALDEESGMQFQLENQLSYNDNFLYSDQQTKGGWILETLPSLSFTALNRDNSYQVFYRMEHSENFESSDDSYTDHVAGIKLRHNLSSRHQIQLASKFSNITEQRGTGFSEGENANLLTSPDDFRQMNHRLAYRFGSQQAKGRLNLSAERLEMDYDSSIVGDSRDHSTVTLGAAFNYRLAPKTDVVLEYRQADTDYDHQPLGLSGAVNLDSDESYRLIGLDWDATAKTSGKIRVGKSNRKFDDASLASDDNFHWEAEISWRPKTYSELVLKTRRLSSETNGLGNYINSQDYQFSWHHAWNGRFRHQLDLGYTDDKFEASSRTDEVSRAGLKFTYDMRRWLDLGAGYRYNERDSDVAAVQYEQNIFFVSADILLD